MTKEQFAARLEALITESHDHGLPYEEVISSLEDAAEALDDTPREGILSRLPPGNL